MLDPDPARVDLDVGCEPGDITFSEFYEGICHLSLNLIRLGFDPDHDNPNTVYISVDYQCLETKWAPVLEDIRRYLQQGRFKYVDLRVHMEHGVVEPSAFRLLPSTKDAVEGYLIPPIPYQTRANLGADISAEKYIRTEEHAESSPLIGTLGCWLELKSQSLPQWLKVALTNYRVIRPWCQGFRLSKAEIQSWLDKYGGNPDADQNALHKQGTNEALLRQPPDTGLKEVLQESYVFKKGAISGVSAGKYSKTPADVAVHEDPYIARGLQTPLSTELGYVHQGVVNQGHASLFARDGDSGSIVWDEDGRALGLVFTGQKVTGAKKHKLVYITPLDEVFDDINRRVDFSMYMLEFVRIPRVEGAE
ncbi:hypothetical protein B0H67DRAFT_650387 [Lasiosphaeris hirsuta]|uniref:Uncharacterized protein n=1 Tax=Lasiosphaeris hirsuta TaxID=260670 RepID=A0AA40DGL7_9PEZI|nr:hypothetical protein B0H67DRAFT_650387 [Lasiosphaeris hirsuta]